MTPKLAGQKLNLEIHQMNRWMPEINIVLDIHGMNKRVNGTMGFKRQDMGAKNHAMEKPHVSGNILAATSPQPMMQRRPNPTELRLMDSYTYVSKFYVGSKTVSEKFLPQRMKNLPLGV